jgi:hypothetical protein
MRASVLAHLAWIMLAQGELDEAERVARRAEEGNMLVGATADAMAVRARIALARGDTKVALDLAREAKALSEAGAIFDIYDYLKVCATLIEVVVATSGIAAAASEIEAAHARLMAWGQKLVDWPTRARRNPAYAKILDYKHALDHSP